MWLSKRDFHRIEMRLESLEAHEEAQDIWLNKLDWKVHTGLKTSGSASKKTISVKKSPGRPKKVSVRKVKTTA